MAARKRDEEGGVFPVFLVAILVCFAMTIVLLHVGRGGDLQTRAQTAADAAALAAVTNIRDRGLNFLSDGYGPYARFSDASDDAAKRYAKKNGATATSVEQRGLLAHTAIVKVKSNDTVGGIFSEFEDARAHAKAIASVEFPTCTPVFGDHSDKDTPPPLLGMACSGNGEHAFVPVGGGDIDRLIDLFRVHLVAHAPPKYQLPVPRRGPAPDGAPGSADLCAQAAHNAGFSGESLVTAVAVALAESSCRPDATNVNTNGSIDEGLWQINTIHGYPRSCTFDPQCNANAAYQISSGGSNFYPWCTYEPPSCGGNGTRSYRQHIPAARAAVKRLGKQG